MEMSIYAEHLEKGKASCGLFVVGFFRSAKRAFIQRDEGDVAWTLYED